MCLNYALCLLLAARGATRVARAQNKFVHLEQRDRGMDKTNFTEFCRAEKKVHTYKLQSRKYDFPTAATKALHHTYIHASVYVCVCIYV